jgi:16S rRNA (guanine527-N7)-methyltransferase
VTSRQFQDRLGRRIRRAGVSTTAELREKLETYFRLLAAWNSKMNLSGLDLNEPPPEAIDRLLVEPLVAARLVAAGAKRAIDIGSGGGSPAIPFALASRVGLVMVESKTRKAVFLREAVRALEMRDTVVEPTRFEELLVKPTLHEAHDLLTLRAVRTEPRVLIGLQAFVKPGGHLLLFGSAPGRAGQDFAPPLSWCNTVALLESTRSVVDVLRKTSKPAPRRLEAENAGTRGSRDQGE